MPKSLRRARNRCVCVCLKCLFVSTRAQILAHNFYCHPSSIVQLSVFFFSLRAHSLCAPALYKSPPNLYIIIAIIFPIDLFISFAFFFLVRRFFFDFCFPLFFGEIVNIYLLVAATVAGIRGCTSFRRSVATKRYSSLLFRALDTRHTKGAPQK